MSSSIIDALPYYDKQVEVPAAKSAAQALIDAELRNTPMVEEDDPRLPPNVDVFPKSTQLTELLEGYPISTIQGIDKTKFGPARLDETSTLPDLIQAESQGRLSEANMSIRLDNISLLSTHGPNAWLIRNYQLNSQLTELQALLGSLKEKITEVNRSRRVYQEDQGGHLGRLEGRWQDLVGGTVQLEMGLKALEGEVRGLRRREEELKTELGVDGE